MGSVSRGCLQGRYRRVTRRQIGNRVTPFLLQNDIFGKKGRAAMVASSMQPVRRKNLSDSVVCVILQRIYVYISIGYRDPLGNVQQRVITMPTRRANHERGGACADRNRRAVEPIGSPVTARRSLKTSMMQFTGASCSMLIHDFRLNRSAVRAKLTCFPTYGPLEVGSRSDLERIFR